ncbi:MAG: pantoate--beta-alanine ligase [Candidatus Aureabacteria bacterium]|nr:pantoate--beta-alanine ligase [Candidatus Auribacterota bacterium]
MRIITAIKEMQSYVKHNYRRGRKIALVPTMGYFHDGHVMLIREARKLCDRLVVSIFVNPLQFGRGEDFATYPRDMKRDLDLAKEEGTNVVFAPTADEFYPPGYSTFVDEEKISKKLCGGFRPGHFKGVTTVVAKLFNIIRPHTAVFGQKDAQQVAIIKKMVRELSYPIHIIVIQTIREKNGLACSSRNEYLTVHERKDAALLYASLQKAQDMVKAGVRDAGKIAESIRAHLASSPVIKPEYVELVNPNTLERVSQIGERTLIALAAHVGMTRLIDNIFVEP